MAVELQQWSWWIAAALSATAIAALLAHKRYPGALAAFSALGCAAMSLNLPDRPDLSRISPDTYVTATVTDARESDSGSRLIVETTTPIRIKAIVYVKSGETLFHKNDIVRVNGVWLRPDYAPDVPYEFSMAPYCFRNGITALCHADRFNIISSPKNHKPPVAERLRERLSDAIRNSGVDGHTADFLDGILLGESEALDSDTRERFSKAGLAHMLALSGTHLAVITAFMAFVFFPLNLGGKRRWAMAATALAMWCYVVLTGAPASVVRAAVMASFVIAGRAMALPTSGINSLCGAALAILLFSPKELYAPGFQMSFLAVAGILMFAPKLTAAKIRNPLLRALNSWCAVSVAAVVATGGISAWLFHRIPAAFLLSNLPAALLLPLLMTGGIALTLLTLAGIRVPWLAASLDWLCEAINGIADMVSTLWWNNIESIWFPGWTLVFYYGGLLLLYIAMERRKPLSWCSAAIVLATFFALSRMLPPKPAGRELFRIRDPFCTAWVVTESRNAWLVSDAPERHKEALRARVAWRLRVPLAIRNIDSLLTAPDTTNTPFFKKNGNKVAVGSTDIVFIDRAEDVAKLKRRPKCAVVGGHYRHGIEAVAAQVNPDTIILSPSLDYSIEQKFAARLDSIGFAYLRQAYRYWK